MLIRAYAEGFSYDKGIVIENDRSTSIESSNIAILIGFNGNSYATEVDGLNIGTMTNGQRALVCHPDAAYSADCDVTNGNILWNGDDAVCVAVGGSCKDVIGVEGSSGPWDAGGKAEATENQVLERKPSVVTATTSWSDSKSQWDVHSGSYNLSRIRDGELSSSPASPPMSPPPFAPPASRGGDECPTAPENPGDRRSSTELRIMTWNARWLFTNPSDDPSISPWAPESTSCPGKQDGLNTCDATGANKHSERVASVIEAMQPDLAYIEEAEDCSVLNHVINTMGSDHGYIPYLLQGTDSFTMQDVGLLARVDPVKDLQRTSDRVSYPILGSQCEWNGSSDTGVSKHVITEFNVNGIDIVIIGAHLKAFPNEPESCAQREAQAKVLQAQLSNEISYEKEVILLGDLNDYSDKTPDINSNSPTSKVLSVLRDVDGDGTDELVNVAQQVQQSNRFTSIYDKDDDGLIDRGERSAIDHMLVSSRLYNSIASVIINQTHAFTSVSDHYPVMLTLNLDENGCAQCQASSGCSISRLRHRATIAFLFAFVCLSFFP